MNTKTGKLRKNLFHYFKGKKFRILSQGRTDKQWRVTKKKNENQGNMEDWKSRENKKRWRNRVTWKERKVDHPVDEIAAGAAPF